jgi:hypothetical protein
MCYTEFGLRRLILPNRQLINRKPEIRCLFDPGKRRGIFIFSLEANRAMRKKSKLKEVQHLYE